jgi:hypothetical protein
VIRQIGDEYDRQAVTLAGIEQLRLEYGVTPTYHMPPGGFKA